MHKFFDRLAKLFAQLGGTALACLIILTCLSISGRILNSIFHHAFLQTNLPGFSAWMIEAGVGPVNGDFELVEAGMAFAIFAFLPICQLHGAHASVDIFTNTLSKKINRMLQAVIAVIFAIVLTVIAWQLMQGMLSKYKSGQTTFLLQFPIWWSYALSLTGAVVAALVGVYVALCRLLEVRSGQEILPEATEANH